VAHSFHGDQGNHLHDIAIEDEKLVRSADFDWESVFYNCDGEELPERMISFADASAAISILTGWLCHSGRDEPADIRTVAAKCEAVLFWLDPNQSKYSGLSAIAEATGLTRAAFNVSSKPIALRNASATSGRLERAGCRCPPLTLWLR
jgi:hypothetical protein